MARLKLTFRSERRVKGEVNSIVGCIGEVEQRENCFTSEAMDKTRDAILSKIDKIKKSPPEEQVIFLTEILSRLPGLCRHDYLNEERRRHIFEQFSLYSSLASEFAGRKFPIHASSLGKLQQDKIFGILKNKIDLAIRNQCDSSELQFFYFLSLRMFDAGWDVRSLVRSLREIGRTGAGMPYSNVQSQLVECLYKFDPNNFPQNIEYILRKKPREVIKGTTVKAANSIFLSLGLHPLIEKRVISNDLERRVGGVLKKLLREGELTENSKEVNQILQAKN